MHVISDVFSPSEKLSFETISGVRPLLIQNYGCQGVGHEDVVTVPEVGCLLLAPPSPVPDVVYPFNRSFLFIDWDYMTAREPGGRWNTRPTLNLRIAADPQRARVAQDAYVNLFLHAFLPPGITAQRLVFSWGHQRRGEITVSGQEWISLPVRTVDWSGNRVWRLPISLAFPDGRSILFHEISVSASPRGRAVTAFDFLTARVFRAAFVFSFGPALAASASESPYASSSQSVRGASTSSRCLI